MPSLKHLHSALCLKGRWRRLEKRCHLTGSEVWAMSAVKYSEVMVSGPGDRQCSGHLQRPVQGGRDTGQLMKMRNHPLEKQLLSKKGQNGKFT